QLRRRRILHDGRQGPQGGRTGPELAVRRPPALDPRRDRGHVLRALTPPQTAASGTETRATVVTGTMHWFLVFTGSAVISTPLLVCSTWTSLGAWHETPTTAPTRTSPSGTSAFLYALVRAVRIC